MTNDVTYEPLLTPAEAARALAITPVTLTRWAQAGKIACIRTPGGHRRYKASEVERIRNGE